MFRTFALTLAALLSFNAHAEDGEYDRSGNDTVNWAFNLSELSAEDAEWLAKELGCHVDEYGTCSVNVKDAYFTIVESYGDVHEDAEELNYINNYGTCSDDIDTCSEETYETFRKGIVVDEYEVSRDGTITISDVDHPGTLQWNINGWHIENF